MISKESEKFGYSKTLDGVFQEKSKESQDCLNLWAASGHSRRGLERWANREHGEKRQQDQFNAIMTVLREQDDMISRKGKVNDEALRRVSHKATRISRHFARMMGKADSYAVAVELKQCSDGGGVDDDGESSLCTAMTLLTSQSSGCGDDDHRSRSSRQSSISTTRSSTSVSSHNMDDESVDISLPAYAGEALHDSCHSRPSRLRRFGFGRKKEPKTPTDPRVSRVA